MTKLKNGKLPYQKFEKKMINLPYLKAYSKLWSKSGNEICLNEMVEICEDFRWILIEDMMTIVNKLKVNYNQAKELQRYAVVMQAKWELQNK
jgi:hypothetical protein